MKNKLLLIIILLISANSFACSCECTGDCSFKSISSGSEFVALVKVIEYSDFLDKQIYNYDKKMPFSMTVEVIEKYIGSEQRKRIKIWGDNGALCRPYIANFEIGKYYLIAPSKITETSENGAKNDYDFFSCFTDYLVVDMNKKLAYGEYSKNKNQISLKDFEKEIKRLNFKNSEWFVNNNERQFYKSDTLTLYKILNKKNKFLNQNDGLIKSEKNENKNFTELNFKKNGNLQVLDVDIQGWTETALSGKWKWTYDNVNYILDLYYDETLHSTFKITSQERDKLIFGENENSDGTTIYLLVLKLQRIK